MDAINRKAWMHFESKSDAHFRPQGPRAVKHLRSNAEYRSNRTRSKAVFRYPNSRMGDLPNANAATKECSTFTPTLLLRPSKMPPFRFQRHEDLKRREKTPYLWKKRCSSKRCKKKNWISSNSGDSKSCVFRTCPTEQDHSNSNTLIVPLLPWGYWTWIFR